LTNALPFNGSLGYTCEVGCPANRTAPNPKAQRSLLWVGHLWPGEYRGRQPKLLMSNTRHRAGRLGAVWGMTEFSALTGLGAGNAALGLRYKNLMLGALIAASAIPILLCVQVFQINSPQIYAATLLFSIVTAMNNSHTWITLAYLFDKKWVAHFRTAPITFFVAPACIVVSTI
jgi:hypothetical protein